MHRPTVGWIALALLIAAVICGVCWPNDTTWRDGCLRPALVLGLLWLAMPQLREVPRWVMIAVAIAALVVLWRPKLLWLAVPAVFAVWILRPRRSPSGQ